MRQSATPLAVPATIPDGVDAPSRRHRDVSRMILNPAMWNRRGNPDEPDHYCKDGRSMFLPSPAQTPGISDIPMASYADEIIYEYKLR